MPDGQANLVVRKIDPTEHREELLQLLEEVFGEKRDQESFIWKYERNPYGKMDVWSVWDQDTGMMVAAFSAFRRFFIYNLKPVTVYQQADAIVKSCYRGKGLFSLLINKVSEHATGEGAHFHFGYTNDLSSSVMRKFPDARELYVSSVYVFLNGTEDLSRTYLKLSKLPYKCVKYLGTPLVRAYNHLRGYSTEPVSYSLKPLSAFSEYPEQWSFDMARDHQYFPLRDEKFLTWKAIDVPDAFKRDVVVFWCMQKVSRIGYVVLYRDESRNIIKLIDVLSDNIHNLRKCISLVRCYAMKHNYDAITTNAASRVYSEALGKEGFIQVKKVRSTVFPLRNSVSSECRFDDTFWMQLPIDRDNFEY